MRVSRLACTLSGLLLAGCAQVQFEQSLQQTQQDTASLQTPALQLATTPAMQSQRLEQAQALLQQPLTQAHAVQLALLHSPALQAMLARHWRDAADAAQSGRVPNPLLSIGRMRVASELELESALSFGLLDLLTLPQRQQAAQHRLQQAQLRLSADVVDTITQVRQAWVRAVAAQQRLHYAEQVHTSAEASAELAQRMLQAGNFNKLNQARQQSYYANSLTALTLAQHERAATRETLVRLLGLNDEQAARLQLPDRLPELPAQARALPAVNDALRQQRLDIRLAKATLDAATQGQSAQWLASYTDIELKAKQKTKHEDNGHTVSGSGFELELRLPLFDWGDAKRQGLQADALQALQQYEAVLRSAGSHVRESYSAYYSAHGLARHYRDVVVPLRRSISEENLLRYNGMLLGVFELLADAREQVNTVQEALQAEQQFWLADAALQAALLGQPTSLGLRAETRTSNADAGGHE